MAARRRKMHATEREQVIAALQRHGHCGSISAAESSAGLIMGTFRDRVIAHIDRGGGTLDSIATIVEQTLLRGVRPTARVGRRGRLKILEEAKTSEYRKCRTCFRNLDESSFKAQQGALGGRQMRCRSCEAWKMRRERYGLTKDEVLDLFSHQGGRCGVCNEVFATPPSKAEEASLSCWNSGPPPYSFHIDHDHFQESLAPRQRTRGLLCSTCNQALPKSILQFGIGRWVVLAAAWVIRARPLTWAPLEPVPSRWGRAPNHGAEAYKEWQHYGLTRADRALLLADQEGRCGICRVTFSDKVGLQIDHDEPAGAPAPSSNAGRERRHLVRGLLCATCNAALGRLRHSPVLLVRVVMYVQAPPARSLWPSG
jgi:hypothetical protein